jgi:hypothetical protein
MTHKNRKKVIKFPDSLEMPDPDSMKHWIKE